VHGLNNTTWASLAQTAGDLLAALWMQLTPRFFPVQDETVIDETWRTGEVDRYAFNVCF